MKNSIRAFLFASAIILSVNHATAWKMLNHPTDSIVSLHVPGVCEMCKERIEAAARGKGVKAAVWNMDTKLLYLSYNSKKTTLKKVGSRIAEAGYDLPGWRANDRAYSSLPECCRHRELSSMDEVNEKKMRQVENNSTGVQTRGDSNRFAEGQVSGIVLHRDEKGQLKPLAGASVIRLGNSAGVASDTNGIFYLQPVSGEKKLVVSYVGFNSDTITIENSNYLEVILTTANPLQEIKLTASSRPSTYTNAYDPIRSIIITPKELKKAACCNLSESFETNPSVDVSTNDAISGSKQIQLLGLSGSYTQLTIENLPGPRGLATPLGLNSIPGTWIESIQLVKGTGSVVNGFESMAGQINVELKKPVTNERLYANVYVNDFGKTDVNLNMTQKLGKKWSTTLLLHDAFLKNAKIDFNKDGFRDLPTGNLFGAVNRWSFASEKGLNAHVGIKLLNDEKVGGQVHFNPHRDRFSTNIYGLEMETTRREAFGKIGYVFAGEKHRSIGLQASAFSHRQRSYFGQRIYNADQQNFYANLIYQAHLANSKHKYRAGASIVHDNYKERLDGDDYLRKEVVTGTFLEYSFTPSSKFDLVAGIREDYNSLYGWFTTPRLNLRYQPWKGTVVRASFGRGQRTANIFAENNSVFASARSIQIHSSTAGKAFGLRPEIAWNKGITADQKFRLGNRVANLSVEFFRTDFKDQVIVDLENPSMVRFYNLKGRSYANSFQAETSFEPVRKLHVRLAYRYFDVMSTFDDQLLERPFTAKVRGFANMAYELKDWKLDYTISYNSKKRIPSADVLPHPYKRNPYSAPYAIMNAQVSKTFGKTKNLDLYLGGENLTNFFQQEVITAADQPFSSHFDAALIWGPVNGRMLYAGVRFSFNK